MANNLTTLRNLFFLTLALLAGIVTAYLLSPQPNNTLNGSMLKTLGGDFTLQSRDGDVSLHDFKGKVAMIYIGYTHCPDVCPTSLAIISQALKNLTDEQQKQVQPLFISVDPERDTPEQLAQYSHFFHPSIIGLTGSREDIDEVVAQYGAFYRMVEMKDSAMDYAVDHSSRIYLINKQGELSKAVTHGTTPEQLKAEITALL
ncbi:SCO family protein [Amphritea sp. 1_MG-2023]|uniref:SCO family protein n=1 Tax=Amphritea sp. 1_MG-2023 TaxID=3062670 RepID=UPI0026E27502|nr:SCO family protein [Amphritea sp. 1_MG-2023]MDO6564952.1 SCO family protein [Amphritea sp. 1_MG-2023]